MSHNHIRRRIGLIGIIIFIIPALLTIAIYSLAESYEVTEPVENSTTPWTTIFSDSFEASNAETWIITDTNGVEDGEYYWAATEITASKGLNSLWSSGGGSDGQGLVPGQDNYPANASSSLTATPISIGNAIALSLTFDIWTDTQSPTDSLQIKASNDGVSFSVVKIVSGAHPIWRQLSVDLYSYVNYDQIWLSFLFSSDATVEGKGVFVDNVVLSVQLEPEQVTIFIPIINEEETPTPTPIPTPTSTVPWLDYINSFRSSMDLQDLSETIEWSYGAELHSRYMVKNDYVTHYEDPSNPWYTPEGAEAGGNSNVFVSGSLATADEAAIDFWMTAPFHAISIIDPQLATTGFGSYRQDDGGWEMGASLDVTRGRGPLPQETNFPLLFPPPDGQTWLLRYWGNEFPNPLTSCPGYTAPTGPPIMVQLGAGSITPDVLGFTLEADGQPLEGCFFDETSYVNSNPSPQNSGRIVLGNRDAVILMPRQPLAAGKEYTVTLTTSDEIIKWTFSTVSPPGFQNSLPFIEFKIR